MNIVSALKAEASRLQQQLNSVHAAIKALGSGNSFGRGVGRPVLKDHPGKIGGHCVIPNCHLLGGEIADFILRANEKFYELVAGRPQPWS